jgi:hypothetical protein
LAALQPPCRGRACGLDNVYLLNSVTLHATEHGPGYSIQRIDELHAAGALAVVSSPLPLRGQGLQFIRSVLRLSPPAWHAPCIGPSRPSAGAQEAALERAARRHDSHYDRRPESG